MAEGQLIQRGAAGLPSFIATGGTVADIEQDGELFRVHTFTSSGTFDVTRGETEIDYLVIGGGGGAGREPGTSFSGSSTGGGGGAGGYRCSVPGELSGANTSAESTPTIEKGSYPVVVGLGGLSQDSGENGGDSSVFGVVSLGGGGGGTISEAGKLGGSSGGSGNLNGTRRLGTAEQGMRGGAGGPSASSGSARSSGGGGGAAQNGADGLNVGSPGKGGIGLESFITGEGVKRAGGGTGGGSGSTGSDNTDFGGGNKGQPGVDGTGGGSGAVGNPGGGSGIVIVRYRIG